MIRHFHLWSAQLLISLQRGVSAFLSKQLQMAADGTGCILLLTCVSVSSGPITCSFQLTQQDAVNTSMHQTHTHTPQDYCQSASYIMTDWAIRLHAPTISFHLGTNGMGRKEDIVKDDG